jgi:hypothetical protein
MSPELNPNIHKHLKYRSLAPKSTALTDSEKLSRLRTWKHWRHFGIRGAALEKKTKLTKKQALQFASDLNFDLGRQL